MSALVLALAASLSWGAGDFLGGLASRKAALTAVLALSMTVGLAAVAVVVLVSGDDAPSTGSALAAAGAGIAGAVGLAGLYRGMAVGAMGVVAPVSAVAAVVPFAVGLAQGERPAPLQLAGAVAALAGVALVSREPAPGGGRRAAGVGLALVAATGFGLYFVLMDEAAGGAGAFWAVLVARATSVVLTVAVALALRASLRVPGRLLPMVAAVGVLDVAANVLFALATTRGLISVVAVLSSLYPVYTVLLARLVLQERTSGVQRVGAAAALAGAALITAG